MRRETAGIVSRGERLRRAVAWMSDQQRHNVATIDEAARRFDLSPAQEEFLLQHFRVTVDGHE